jgi:hypothetical protein
MLTGNVAHGTESVGFRERLNRSPKVTFAVIAAVILAAVAYAYVGSRDSTEISEPQLFYSADDGKTWFKDSAYLLVPSDRNGAQVVRAKVFTDGSRARVCYLERFKAPVLTHLAELLKNAQHASQPASSAFQNAGLGPTSIEVKAPGAKQWIPITSVDQAAKVIRQFQVTPNDQLTPVEP